MRIFISILTLLVLACGAKPVPSAEPEVFVTILGIAQDAGAPQIGCQKACCSDLWDNPQKRQKVIALGLVDRLTNQVWLIEGTPDFKDQLNSLMNHLPGKDIKSLGGIFLTHAHTGHYTGLMELGREAMGAKNVPVYGMPRMVEYLATNGPWSQLVKLNNIALSELRADSTIQLSENLSLSPFLVPHRDEYSETVGYKVTAASKSFLFIPDIDKWYKWDRNIVEEVEKVDFAFLDGAFYSQDELPNRNMNEIPHPFVPETMQLFEDTETEVKKKIIFIHLNHTNPLLKDGPEYRQVLSSGYNIGREGQIFSLE